MISILEVLPNYVKVLPWLLQAAFCLPKSIKTETDLIVSEKLTNWVHWDRHQLLQEDLADRDLHRSWFLTLNHSYQSWNQQWTWLSLKLITTVSTQSYFPIFFKPHYLMDSSAFLDFFLFQPVYYFFVFSSLVHEVHSLLLLFMEICLCDSWS